MGRNGPKLLFSEFWGQMIYNEGSHAYVWTKLEKMIFSVPKWAFGPKKSQKMTFFKKWKKRPQVIFPTSGKHKRIILKTIQGLKNPPQLFCPRTDGRTTTMIAIPLSEISPRGKKENRTLLWTFDYLTWNPMNRVLWWQIRLTPLVHWSLSFLNSKIVYILESRTEPRSLETKETLDIGLSSLHLLWTVHKR